MSNLKKKIEARQEKTGESWQTASRHVRGETQEVVAPPKFERQEIMSVLFPEEGPSPLHVILSPEDRRALCVAESIYLRSRGPDCWNMLEPPRRVLPLTLAYSTNKKREVGVTEDAECPISLIFAFPCDSSSPQPVLIRHEKLRFESNWLSNETKRFSTIVPLLKRIYPDKRTEELELLSEELLSHVRNCGYLTFGNVAPSYGDNFELEDKKTDGKGAVIRMLDPLSVIMKKTVLGEEVPKGELHIQPTFPINSSGEQGVAFDKSPGDEALFVTTTELGSFKVNDLHILSVVRPSRAIVPFIEYASNEEVLSVVAAMLSVQPKEESGTFDRPPPRTYNLSELPKLFGKDNDVRLAVNQSHAEELEYIYSGIEHRGTVFLHVFPTLTDKFVVRLPLRGPIGQQVIYNRKRALILLSKLSTVINIFPDGSPFRDQIRRIS
jgi:hypothetical protein